MLKTANLKTATTLNNRLTRKYKNCEGSQSEPPQGGAVVCVVIQEIIGSMLDLRAGSSRGLAAYIRLLSEARRFEQLMAAIFVT